MGTALHFRARAKRQGRGSGDARQRPQPRRECEIPDIKGVCRETEPALHQLLHADAQREKLCHRAYPQVPELKNH